MGRCSAISKEEQDCVEKALARSKSAARNLCLFVLGVETGLRISELLSIRIGDVVNVSGEIKTTIVIQKAFVKGGRHARHISLSPRAREVIYQAVAEASALNRSQRERFLFEPSFRRGAITRRQAYDVISSALKSAGINHTRGTHTMRKTRAERVARFALKKNFAGETQKLPTVAVKLALGHCDIRTTERYLDTGVEEVNQWTAAGMI